MALALADILLAITELLNKSELRGVLAHELAHVKNRDILIATVAAVIAGAISSFANIFLWTGGGRNRDNGMGLLGLLMMILAPISAAIIQMAISRQREFAADHTGSSFSMEPIALASALEKIEASAVAFPMKKNNAMASLYIGNPMGVLKGMSKLFSTHPPTDKRVEKLRSMVPGGSF